VGAATARRLLAHDPMKTITPGIFLAAALFSTGCTDTDDTEPQDEQPDVAECCAPPAPRGTDPVYDSFDLGRRARERFDLLRRTFGNK
jgi:hypothetical protein